MRDEEDCEDCEVGDAVRRAMGEAGDGSEGDNVQSSARSSSSSDEEAVEHWDTQLDDEVVEGAGERGATLMRRADGDGTEVRWLGMEDVDDRIREDRVGIVGEREAR